MREPDEIAYIPGENDALTGLHPSDEDLSPGTPMLAVWAETGLVLADEFRDGNVPAMMSPLTVAQRSFDAFAGMEMEFHYRGDSASHEHRLLAWLRNPERPGGPKDRSASPSAPA